MKPLFFQSQTSVEFVHSHKADLGCELVGSWTVSVGDMDQALHLWRYTGGFEKIDKAKILFRENPVSYLDSVPDKNTLERIVKKTTTK